MRKYLVFISTNHGKAAAELYGEDRLFDVAVHDYGPWQEAGLRDHNAEYWIPSPKTEKLETAAVNVSSIPSYEQYAFLDDDLTVSTDQLNKLFSVGAALDLELYQPSLNRNSYGSYPHLYHNDGGALIRPVPLVEIMAPFFSRKALDKCLWSFDLNISGWGLDVFIWPKLVRTVLVDLPIGHYRQFSDKRRVGRNGLDPFQELMIVQKINYDGSSPW